MFKFKVSYIALVAALTSASVYANPTIYTHLNGATVVDIEAPNAAGVSHNMYTDFNVSSKGMILNNSGVNVTHPNHGNIAKNNNLANGSASVILNEVVSNRSSSLAGFIEVNGQKTDVIIANPNGITCSGCSFINTNKAVLTTGKVNLTDTGAIGTYSVSGGQLKIEGTGMSANNSYAVLLADAVKISGQLNAANVLIGGGNFTFNNQTGRMTSSGKTATMLQNVIPEYSVDITTFGGIKANSITITGNNLGFGVRNIGRVQADSMLNISSNGQLVNIGAIDSRGMLTQLASAGQFSNTGGISSNNLTMVTSLSGIKNEGDLISSAQLVLQATGDMENKGHIKGANALMVATDGNLKTAYGSSMFSDQLTVSAKNNIQHGGGMQAKNATVSFGDGQLSVTGHILTTENLLIQSVNSSGLTSGEINNNGQLGGNNITLQTKGSLIQGANGKTIAKENLNAQSYWLKNEGFMEATSMIVNNGVTHNYGDMNSVNLDLTSYNLVHNEGNINASRDMSLSTQNQGDITNRGSLRAGGTMTIKAKNVINGGYKCGFLNLKTCGEGRMYADQLVLNSNHTYANEMGGTQYFKSIETNKAK